MYHAWRQSVYTALVGKQDGKRSCGRPKHGGEDRDILVQMCTEKIAFENGLNLYS